MTTHLEELEVPPPPYTETDIYSTSGGARSPLSPTHPHRRDSYGGGDDIATHSTSASTNGDVIYTPPLTPRSSSHHSNFGTGDHLTNSSSAAAAAYFESRPFVPPPEEEEHRNHQPSQAAAVFSYTIGYNTRPDELPYPTTGFGISRDITREDWQTFVNYLLPHHAAASNEQVIDRKLRAERSNSNDDARSSHAEAQLEQIRSTPVPPGDNAAQRRQHVEDTAREWNEGFFGPRNVVIRVTWSPASASGDEGGKLHVPGAWDQTFDHQTQTERNEGPSGSRFGRFNPFGGVDNRRGGGGGGGGGGFRFGGITLDGDRVAIGDSFVAGRNGVRIGGFVADTNGISMNGNPMFGGALPGGVGFPFGGPHRGGFGPFGGGGGPWGGGPRGGRGWGGREGRGGGGDGEKGDDHHHDHHERGRHGGRGRGRHRADRHSRVRSTSSASSRSSSSSSSSSSVSSVGSLPDYDDLRDTQLPIAREHLVAWLNHPDQPATKEKVKQVKEQIKAAKKTDANGNDGINEPANIAYDKAALRKEVKGLLQEWKSLKKQQKKLSKQLKRERRNARRAERKEHKKIKREMKKARKDFRKGPFPVPGVPPVPPVPQHPFGRWCGSGPYHGHGGPFGAGRGGGGWPFGSGGVFGGGGDGNNVRSAPGAWPDNNNNNDASNHRASETKYREAENLESQLEQKEVELIRVHERMAHVWDEESNHAEKSKSVLELTTRQSQLERELESLTQSMTRLRTEADAEFARELAQEEERGHY
ncbi:hypothetical protein QBC46DRAFT_256774 [Diplogelasinospora grovesii]|uniref:Uncharacterized protein n=1 Tax=Diplogelasinospora grovesii TaxID=303347 RepID=A0AAN6NEI0_9PEZI|nr:hypothetical protein QBC46DRAFT_256774 [Diplogelasinospora grovesii]